MRRTIALLLILTLLFGFSACKSSDDTLEVPATFYYLNDEIDYGIETGVISFEEQETVHIQGDISALLVQYLQGPNDPQLSRAVPVNVSLESVQQVGKQIIITLSPEFSYLNGIDLTLACSCLCMTVLDYTQAHSVQFLAEGEFLGEGESITMTREDIVQMDTLLTPSEAN